MRILWRLKKGYTLIEMAIVMLVAGVVLASGADVYRAYNAHQVQATNAGNVTAVAQAIGGYLTRFGRYPCPSDISLPRTDPNYGMETGCDPTNPPNTPPYVVTAAGSCWPDGGICIQKAASQPSPYPAPSTGFPVPGTLLVRRGGIPFRVMNLSEDQTLDAYGNRLQYAVTEPLAVANSYNNTFNIDGGINVTDTTSINTATNVHFVVFSTGADQAGAFSRDGKLVAHCSTGALNSANCTTSTAATFNTALYNPTATSHYDDTLRYFTSMSIPMWRPDMTGLIINDSVQATFPGGPELCNDPNGCRVAIGSAQPTAALDVTAVNNVNVSTGPTTTALPVSVQTSSALRATSICDVNGLCLTPSTTGLDSADLITTNDKKDMLCPKASDPPSAVYATGFANSQVQCSQIPAVTCGPGQFVAGINPDGSLICSTGKAQCTAINPQNNNFDVAPLTAAVGCNGNEEVLFDPTKEFTTPGNVGDTHPVSMSKYIQSNILLVDSNGDPAPEDSNSQKQMQGWLAAGMPTSGPTTPGVQYNEIDYYTCQANGYWTYSGSSGWCGCSIQTQTTQPPLPNCSQLANNNFNWGAGNTFTGLGTMTYTETTTQVQSGDGGATCGGAWGSVPYNSTITFKNGTTLTYTSLAAENAGTGAMLAACDKCQPTPAVTWSGNCTPSKIVGGYNTGKLEYQDNWSCSIYTDTTTGLPTTTPGPNTVPGGWLNDPTPLVLTDTCSCVVKQNKNTTACPTGYTGTGIVTETDTTCTDPATPDPNYTGTSPQQVIGTKVGPYVLSNDCTFTCLPDNVSTFPCNSSLVQQYDPSAYSAVDNTGSVVMEQKYECSTQSFDAFWTPVSSTCGCAATVQTQYVACAAGYAGQQAQTRTYNCSTGIYGTWTNTATGTTCAPQGSGQWNAASGPAGPYPSNPTPANSLGGACSPTGLVAACSQPVTGGFTYYQTCYCQ